MTKARVELARLRIPGWAGLSEEAKDAQTDGWRKHMIALMQEVRPERAASYVLHIADANAALAQDKHDDVLRLFELELNAQLADALKVVATRVETLVPVNSAVHLPASVTAADVTGILSASPQVRQFRDAVHALEERAAKQKKALEKLRKTVTLHGSSIVDLASVRAYRMAAAIDKISGYLQHKHRSIHYHGNAIGALRGSDSLSAYSEFFTQNSPSSGRRLHAP